MALIEGPRCPWGHADCPGHRIPPLLLELPERDRPNAGRCWCGQVAFLWHVPLDDRWYCVSCLRMALRIAIYPSRFEV